MLGNVGMGHWFSQNVGSSPLYVHILFGDLLLSLCFLHKNAGAMCEFPKPPTFKRGRRTEPGTIVKSISQASDSLPVGFSCDHCQSLEASWKLGWKHIPSDILLLLISSGSP